MSDSKPYDVFLSYNSQDRMAVKQLAMCLQDSANLTVWFDDWSLIPGNSWQEEIERALDASKTCVVFIGPGSLGPWHNEEMRSALQIRVERNDFRVIPVLLPGASLPERGKLPRFLSRLHAVDLRDVQDLCEPRFFNRLVAGIRGIPPGRDDISSISLSTECPYRGLEAFDEEHKKFFFGRDALTQHLVEELRTSFFIAVLGASGSGKSSLARAGLLPMLKAGALPFSDRWTYVVFKPGASPLQELALNLARAGQAVDRIAVTQELLRHMESDESSFHIYVRHLLADKPIESRLFVLIDQFEEIFTLCKDQVEQAQFIKNLRYAGATNGGQTIITLTMRADYLARASGYAELAEMLSGHQFVVSPMDTTEFRQAIEEPARLVGLQFERGLVNKILNDVRKEPGALPLLEDTLLELCRRRTSNRLTLRDYEEVGGVSGSLEKRADAIFSALPPPQQLIAIRILLRLTQPGEGSEDTRRRAPLSELITAPDEQAEVEHVINYLIDARLLTTYTEEGKERQVDVAHEALIRGWPRLRRWIEEDRESLRAHRRLTEAAQLWRDNNKEESYLYGGARLAQSKEWRSHHGKFLSLRDQEFLDASVELEEKGRRLTQRRRRITIGSIAVGLAVITGYALFWYQVREANMSRSLAAEVRLALERGKKGADYYKILNLAVEAVEISRTTEAEDALRKSLVRGSHIDYVHPQKAISAIFSPDGKSILTVSEDNIARIWDVETNFGASPVLISKPRLELSRTSLIKGAVYSKDSRLVLTISGDNTGQLWDARTGEMLHSKISHEAAFRAAFSPDGRRIVTASNDRTVRLWDAETGQELRSLKHPDPVYQAEFSPNGKYLLTVDGVAKLWDTDSFKYIRSIGSGIINFATFSPDGRTVVTVDTADAFAYWNVDDGQSAPPDEQVRKKVIASRLFYGDVSSDGKVTVTVDNNGQALLKDTEAGNRYEVIAEDVYNVPIISATFSANNNLLLAVLNDNEDRSVRLYECDICGSFDELLNRAKDRVGRKSVYQNLR